MGLDPSIMFSQATGDQPDPWQRAVLRSDAPRLLLNCCRQSGKSTTVAALALHTALFSPDSLVLLLSPSQRQSGELFRKVADQYQALGRPVPTAGPRDNQLRLQLRNGSRVVSLPGTEGTVRGFSGVDLLVIDEAARVADPLYLSLRPMLAVSRGRLVALSTPHGRRGWWFEAWTSTGEPWERVRVPASECPRIDREFLDEERLVLGPRWFAQEYCCSFEESVGGVFSSAALDVLLTPAVAAIPFPGAGGR